MTILSITDQYKVTCAQIINGCSVLLQWQWEERFDAALSTLDSGDAPGVLQLLQDTFHQQLSDAPGDCSPAVREIVTECSGLHAGQHLFLSGLDQGLVLVAMWWPWGNGKTISLRVRLVPVGIDEETTAEAYGHFRVWFGLD